MNLSVAKSRVFGILKVVLLEQCAFPIVQSEVAGYKVLMLPEELRRLFDEGRASVVRINSIEVANMIPDFGGRGSGESHGLLPHQDHLDPSGDQRRFLMLSKGTNGARGASTLILNPSVAAAMLPYVQIWLTNSARRLILGNERAYDRRFLISPEQYNSCFDVDGGYEQVIATVLGANATAQRELAVRLGILGYLMRGPSADCSMQELMEAFPGTFYEERWEQGGVVIIDNPRVFHARMGGNNPPLQRNFCI